MANRMQRIVMSRVIILNVGRGAAWRSGVRKGVKLLMIVCRFCLFLLSYRMGGGFTRSVAEGHGLSDCFFTRSVAESHGFFFLTRIVGIFFFFLHTECRGGHELSNFLHTENRGRSRIFLHTECWKCGGVGD